MPYATRFIGALTVGLIVLLALLWSGPRYQKESHLNRLVVQGQLVARLGLTDLCLFTEAPYTRHLSLATTAQPFQAHPLATAHFPTGSIVAPPARFFDASPDGRAP